MGSAIDHLKRGLVFGDVQRRRPAPQKRKEGQVQAWMWGDRVPNRQWRGPSPVLLRAKERITCLGFVGAGWMPSRQASTGAQSQRQQATWAGQRLLLFSPREWRLSVDELCSDRG